MQSAGQPREPLIQELIDLLSRFGIHGVVQEHLGYGAMKQGNEPLPVVIHMSYLHAARLADLIDNQNWQVDGSGGGPWRIDWSRYRRRADYEAQRAAVRAARLQNG